MADRTEKHPGNVPGPYYNDTSCIDCDYCREIAPQVFRRDDEEGLSYVWHQPVSPEEQALARKAMEGCPTETIGCDG
ncbi:ferredoxin [Luteolibacter flavescens]|uniref:Ferredoxin n=1 Tax=Luteolibacter flavescens TaxID=1859460 RepID=A0ABT3FU23_9BACT|nr:ferredoxin [Luteolibacter flavescens]MCW1887086.1 ferredoxin [Luteolibacter flavescens]